MNNLTYSYFTEHIFDLLEVLIIALSVWFLRKQIKETHEWNRRKATQDTLYEIATGNLQDLMRKIRYEFDCDIFSNSPPSYNKTAEQLTEEKLKDFNSTLVNIVNRLEIVCISIRHHVIDEDICYDYLGKIIPAYFDLAEPLIQQRRKTSGFQRGIGSLELYAERWKRRLERENEIRNVMDVKDYKETQIKRKLVPSKRPL